MQKKILKKKPMEILHAHVCEEAQLEPYQAYENLTQDPQTILEISPSAISKLCWDYRVIELLRNTDSAFLHFLAQSIINRVWLPPNASTLPWRDPNIAPEMRPESFLFDKMSDRGKSQLVDLENKIRAHNLAIIHGENPSDLSPFEVFSPNDLEILSKVYYIPNLYKSIPPNLNDLNERNAIEQIAVILHRNLSPLMSTDGYLWQIMTLDKSQWSDAPTNPCEIRARWPMWLKARCHAMCKNAQCLRHAQPSQIFCKFHGFTSVTMHVRPVTKRKEAKDVTSQEYQDHSISTDRYPQTKRMANPMLFAASEATLSSRSRPSGFYLPVVRYDALYYTRDATSQNFCGKFFFYEPDSHLFLYLGNTRFYATKVQAFVHLQKEANPSDPPKDEEWRGFGGQVDPTRMTSLANNSVPGMKDLWTTIRSSLHLNPDCGFFRAANNRRDFTIACDSFIESRYCSVFLSQGDLDDNTSELLPVLFPSDNPQKITVITGEFDDLDQPICRLAERNSIDTVIFQHEIGGNDCVTEIMDTRQDWQKHLHEFRDPIIVPRKYPSKYPKIWFPRDDGVVWVGGNISQADMHYTLDGVFGNVVRPLPPSELKCDVNCEAVTKNGHLCFMQNLRNLRCDAFCASHQRAAFVTLLNVLISPVFFEKEVDPLELSHIDIRCAKTKLQISVNADVVVTFEMFDNSTKVTTEIPPSQFAELVTNAQQIKISQELEIAAFWDIGYRPKKKRPYLYAYYNGEEVELEGDDVSMHYAFIVYRVQVYQDAGAVKEARKAQGINDDSDESEYNELGDFSFSGPEDESGNESGGESGNEPDDESGDES